MRIIFSLRASLLVVGFGLAACGGATVDGAPCASVGGQFFKIATEDMSHEKGDEVTKRAVHNQLPAMRDALVHACTDDKWSGTVRDCMSKAKDRAGLETCQLQLTDPQRAALAARARGEEPKSP